MLIEVALGGSCAVDTAGDAELVVEEAEEDERESTLSSLMVLDDDTDRIDLTGDLEAACVCSWSRDGTSILGEYIFMPMLFSLKAFCCISGQDSQVQCFM